jgi:hypothetical protein
MSFGKAKASTHQGKPYIFSPAPNINPQNGLQESPYWLENLISASTNIITPGKVLAIAKCRSHKLCTSEHPAIIPMSAAALTAK